jgi:hypothetical protein
MFIHTYTQKMTSTIEERSTKHEKKNKKNKKKLKLRIRLYSAKSVAFRSKATDKVS